MEAKEKKKKRVDNHCCLGQQIDHILPDVGLGHPALPFTSTLFQPVTFRKNPKNKGSVGGGAAEGSERIKRKVSNGNLMLFVFVARGLTKHSGYRFNYALESGSRDRPHSKRKCFSCLFSFSLLHSTPNILHAAEGLTRS